MKKLFFLILISMTSILYSQDKDVIGIYGEGLIGKLNTYRNYIELKPDSTFIYNYLGRKYKGNWELSENKILLNPKIKKEYAKITLKESKIDSDSVTIKINYIPKNDSSKNKNFRMATVYFDKKGNYINILKTPYIRSCGWAPSIKKQKILNSNNSVTVSQKDFSQIGFMTYNLNDYILFSKADKDSNFFEFDIKDVPDDEDIIKDDFFIIDGKFLYYPNKKGKKDVMQMPLFKKKM